MVQNMDREMKKCLVEAYKLTDEDFLRVASQATPSWKDGSTAVTVLVLNDVIYCANVGDSKAYLCRRTTPGAPEGKMAGAPEGKMAGAPEGKMAGAPEGKMAFVPLTKEHSPSIVREGLGTRCWAPNEFSSSCSLKRERE